MEKIVLSLAFMKNSLIITLTFLLILTGFSGCIVRSPYDRQYWTKPRPHAMLYRPHAVKSKTRYNWGPTPFGVSSQKDREHYRRYHGSALNRHEWWPRRFIPHPWFHNANRR